jgi:hypothetical protein
MRGGTDQGFRAAQSLLIRRPGTMEATLGVVMRKSLLIALVIAAAAPSLADAKVRRHAPPPPPPVDTNAAGARLVGDALKAFLITPFEATFSQPQPQPVSAPRHHARKKSKQV